MPTKDQQRNHFHELADLFTHDKQTSLTGLYSQVIRESLDGHELDPENLPFLSEAIRPLLDQMVALTQKLEAKMEEQFIEDPTRLMTHKEVEKADFDDDVEEQFIRLINYIAKISRSLGEVLNKGSYRPHNVYKNQGVLISEKTRHELEPAIQIQFVPVDLRNFGNIQSNDLGLNQNALQKSESAKAREQRSSAETAAGRIASMINEAMIGWKTDIASASAKGKQPGIVFRFGRVGENGFETYQKDEISLSIEVRYSAKEGLHLLPSLRFANQETRDRKMNLTVEGTPVSINSVDNPTQETVNIKTNEELSKLGLVVN